MGKLDGQIALVTGAARGLGRAYALHLAQLGADVVINDIDLDAAEEYDEELTAATVMTEIENLGRRSLGIRADVARRNEAFEMTDEIVDTFGRIDILVNNAGAIPGGSIDRVDEATWRQAWDLKVFGYINICRLAYNRMRDAGHGVIINVIGAAGERPSTG